MNKPKEFSARIARVQWLTEDCFKVYVDPGAQVPEIGPGQFFMVRLLTRDWPLLPRPFSIYRVEEGKLSFIIKAIGRGTRALGAAQEGDAVHLTGPLGQPFPEVDPSRGAVAIAGGIGIAPFAHWMEGLVSGGMDAGKIHLVYGGQTSAMLYDLPFYEKLGVRIVPATDDGSTGFKGNVLQCLEAEIAAGRIDAGTRMIACGPDPMLEVAWEKAGEKGWDLYLSLETYMACGIAICNGCSVPVKPECYDGWPYAKACREGPTFAAKDLNWS